MSFVKAVPEALTSASGQFQGIGETLVAQNAAAVAPTTVIAPAGADPISMLQAALFGNYGSLYQSISDQAAVVHQQTVQALAQSAAAYDGTEATNQASTSLSSAIDSFLTNILGVPTSGSSSVLSGNFANIENIGIGNWASAGSNLLGMAGGGLLDFPEEVAAEAEGGLLGAGLTGTATPIGGAPILAGMGQAAPVGGLSAPPAWGETAAATGSTPVRLAANSWASPATPAHTTVPAGMPAVASGSGRSGMFGTPRYGAKPIVMPKPKVG